MINLLEYMRFWHNLSDLLHHHMETVSYIAYISTNTTDLDP